MTKQNLFTSFLAIVLCASLSACATQKISPQARARIHSIRVRQPDKRPEADYYMDTTIQAVETVSMQFGLIGALLGGGVAAIDQNAGLRRWAPVTAGHVPLVQNLVRENLSQEFAQTAALRCNPPGPVDATLAIQTISYGVCHDGDQRFKAVIRTEITLNQPDGKVLWKSFSRGTSASSFTLAQCASQPSIYPDALQEAGRSLAQRLVAQY